MAKRKIPKAPKKPRASASLSTWERYDQRVKDWHKKVSAIHHAEKKKSSLVKKYSHGSHLSIAHRRVA